MAYDAAKPGSGCVAVDWARFLRVSTERRALAEAAAGAARAADLDGAAALLGRWPWADDRVLLRRLVDEMTAAPTLSAASAVVFGADLAAWLPERPVDGDLIEHRSGLFERVREDAASAEIGGAGRGDPLAVRLDHLGALGDALAARRGRWRRAAPPDDPALDAATAALWTAWVEERPFAEVDTWERLFLGPLVQAYLGVVGEGGGLDQRRSLAQDLAEGSFFVLVGSAGRTPGWRKILARVVEAGGADPIEPLFAALGPVERGRLADGAAQRQFARRTLALLREDVADAPLAAALCADSARFLPIADFHVACRLVSAWSEGEVGGPADQNVVVQNDGRLRTRLRALLAEGPVSRCWPPPGGLVGLHARTLDAVRRYGRAWAQSRRPYRYTPDNDFEVDLPCTTPPDPWPVLEAADVISVRCWLLSVALGGRLGHLRDWVFRGGTGDRDTVFGRRLKNAPAALLAEPRPGDAAGYRHLRRALARRWDGWLADVRPALVAVAAIDPDAPDRKRQVLAALGPDWDPRIDRPSGRRDNVLHARSALAMGNGGGS